MKLCPGKITALLSATADDRGTAEHHVLMEDAE